MFHHIRLFFCSIIVFGLSTLTYALDPWMGSKYIYSIDDGLEYAISIEITGASEANVINSTGEHRATYRKIGNDLNFDLISPKRTHYDSYRYDKKLGKQIRFLGYEALLSITLKGTEGFPLRVTEKWEVCEAEWNELQVCNEVIKNEIKANNNLAAMPLNFESGDNIAVTSIDIGFFLNIYGSNSAVLIDINENTNSEALGDITWAQTKEDLTLFTPGRTIKLIPVRSLNGVTRVINDLTYADGQRTVSVATLAIEKQNEPERSLQVGSNFNIIMQGIWLLN